MMHDADLLPSPPEWDLLLSASQKNDPDEIRRLVEEEGVPVTHSNVVGQTALHIAALWGRVEALETLLQLGGNVHAPNKLAGLTPLHCALRGTFQSFRETHPQRLRCLRLLLDAGADVRVIDSRGKDVWDHLEDMAKEAQMRGVGDVEGEMREMRDVLEGGGVDKSEVLTCVEEGDGEGLRKVLEREGVGERERNRGLVRAVEGFVSRMGDEEKTVEEDWFRSSADVIRCLLEFGANPNTSSGNDSKQTDPILENAPLHMITSRICSSSPTEQITRALPHATTIVRDLRKHGALCGAKTKSLLPDSGRRGDLEAIRFLVEEVGVDPNYQGRQGMTCLHFAARGGKKEVVAWLLGLGDSVDVGVKDNAGKTALDYASANGKEDIVDMLSKKMNELS